jgi:ATP-dependent exoDNAse (exonuclease V) beta subunit
MNDPQVADAAQRRRALAVDESFIVQAPAGSGKTELLTQRYLRLLAEVAHPEEICAITFTRKAAAEMRNRVLTALAAASDRQRPTQPHRRLTWDLARAVLARDEALDWQIVRNPNRLRVQTFDSLCHALARQMPLLSELGAAPATSDHADPLYRAAARATLQQLEGPELGRDIERLLVHLDNRQTLLEDLLCHMLARREQWLGHVLLAPDGQRLDDALEAAVGEHLQQLAQACRADWLQALIDLARQAAGNLRATSDNPALAAWRDRDRIPGTGRRDLPAWQGLAQLLLTRGGQLRRQWQADIGFPPPSEKGLADEEKARRASAKAAVKALCEELAEQPEALALWAALRLLPGAGLDTQQQAVLGSLFRVLLHAAAELQLVFQTEGSVDFAESQLRAQRALGSAEEPTDLALAIDYRLQHLLIDEFQDTSSSQYHLLATLTAGWVPGDGRTLFAVGDPMQSIYRFREAEVGLYLAARELGIGQLRLTPLTLQVNFRSDRGIVDWVNTSFRSIFPSRVDIARGAVPYAPAVAHHPSVDGDAVQVHAFAGDSDQAEAARVVDLVRTALRETETGQVAVLARARSHLRTIAAALQAAGLRFQAVDVDALAQQAVVRDLHALTRALLHPADRLSWLVTLRGPCLGLGLEDLLLIAEANSHCIPARLCSAEVRSTLSADGRRRVERLLQVLDDQIPARGRRALRPWIEGIWLRLGGLAVAGARHRADAQAYLALLEAHEQAGGIGDFAELDAALSRLYATPDHQADGRIQLMTMHKAKGLEFDTVILPGLGRRARGNPSSLLYWLERTSQDGTTHLLMAPIRAAEQQAEPISDYLRELDRDKDQLETARLLYVAATRAKRRLHLLGHIGVTARGLALRPVAGCLLDRLWPAVEPYFNGLQPPTAAPVEPEQPRLAPLQRLPADWQPALLTEMACAPTPRSSDGERSDIEFIWAGDTARHVGTVVHRHLERIASQGIDDWLPDRVATLSVPVRRGLRHLGVQSDQLELATDKTLRALRHTLADDTGRWILRAHRDARSEWPLTLHDNVARHFVIDRSFIDDQGVRWIIDYKTGEHLAGDREAFLDQEQARYREQLETYGRILRLLEDRPIRLALYFPLFPDWRVWDYPG